MAKKRLLIVAPEFPPKKGIGRIRPLKFAKHLSKFGWKSVVLTVKINKFLPIDIRLLEEIPIHVKVYRTSLPRIIDSFIDITKKIVSGNIYQKKNDNSGEGVPATRSQRLSKLQRLSLITQYVKKFSYKYLLIPDDAILWVPGAYYRAVNIFKKKFPQFSQQHLHFLLSWLVTSLKLNTIFLGYVITEIYGLMMFLENGCLAIGKYLKNGLKKR